MIVDKLSITPGKAVLSSDTLWGALRGLETFSQLVYETEYESHGLVSRGRHLFVYLLPQIYHYQYGCTLI